MSARDYDVGRTNWCTSHSPTEFPSPATHSAATPRQNPPTRPPTNSARLPTRTPDRHRAKRLIGTSEIRTQTPGTTRMALVRGEAESGGRAGYRVSTRGRIDWTTRSNATSPPNSFECRRTPRPHSRMTWSACVASARSGILPTQDRHERTTRTVRRSKCS